MTDIKLQFVLGKGLSSRLIAWWGQGYGGYSHVDGVLENGTLIGARSDRVGGQPSGFQIRPANYESWAKRRVVTFPNTADKYPAWSSWLTSQVGYGYDKGDILGLIFGLPLLEEGHWICSAAQTQALRLDTVRLLPPSPVPPQQVTPNTLFSMAVAVGGVWSDPA